MYVAVGTETFCLLSVPVFGAAETPNELSQGPGLPLLQDSGFPCPSATFVGCHSLGPQSLLVTVKIFTLMALCGFPSV